MNLAARLESTSKELGFEIVANTPEQSAQFQARENARWKTVIETGKITAD